MRNSKYVATVVLSAGLSANACDGGADPDGAGEETTAQSANARDRSSSQARDAGEETEASGEASDVDLSDLDCELTGRWLVTTHLTTDAIGALQYGHYYEYYEIEQQGGDLTVAKGFMCQADAVGDGTLAADVDFSAANPSLPSKVRYDGRTGTVDKSAKGCRIELERWYTVRGATTPHYLDPSIELPTADQEAVDGEPGWEDWDDDGNPGITGVLNGIISGEIFVAPRLWTTMQGTVTDVDLFTLGVEWGQEQNVMAFDGSALLATEAAVGPDPSTHFVQFYRLADDEATGDDDLAVCEKIIEMAPQVTPEGAGS